uniref:Uncharacterized protein n=1 Tax=Timema tahoe TaxID=61484 RepID=A0A7R9FK13_9NEOP|nr:unnamed protein product [Timema tahoe]
MPLSRLDRYSNPDLPVISRPVQYESDAFDHLATEAPVSSELPADDGDIEVQIPITSGGYGIRAGTQQPWVQRGTLKRPNRAVKPSFFSGITPPSRHVGVEVYQEIARRVPQRSLVYCESSALDHAATEAATTVDNRRVLHMML